MPIIRRPPAWRLPERAATPESIYLDRRRVVAGLGLGGLALGLGAGRALAATLGPGLERGLAGAQDPGSASTAESGGAGAKPGLTRPAVGDRFADRFPAPPNEAYGLGGRPLTDEATAAGYNNFYEFTTTKDRVWELARGYPVDPWTVRVHGKVRAERTLDLDRILGGFPLEERLYRFRCVERWAMQVPWTGYPLAALIDSLDPLPSAKYVRFDSVLDPERLPGQKSQPWYPWPYVEALRMDEATHPLAFVAVGVFGHALPMQHGAPWRLALPWKYGYKSPKSIVEIEFTEKRPDTFWNTTTPREYGFYSNVDPRKPHPRWSQAREKDIGTGETRATELYNGYAEEVAELYDGDEF